MRGDKVHSVTIYDIHRNIPFRWFLSLRAISWDRCGELPDPNWFGYLSSVIVKIVFIWHRRERINGNKGLAGRSNGPRENCCNRCAQHYRCRVAAIFFERCDWYSAVRFAPSCWLTLVVYGLYLIADLHSFCQQHGLGTAKFCAVARPMLKWSRRIWIYSCTRQCFTDAATTRPLSATSVTPFPMRYLPVVFLIPSSVDQFWALFRRYDWWGQCPIRGVVSKPLKHNASRDFCS